MQKITILTGAGISAESGLGTFRDEGGLWDQYDLNDVATPEGFQRDPALVHAFYNARRANCIAAAPNAAHRALASLARDYSGKVTLITQNIDDLHERAGHTDVIHMHGELMRALCAGCDHRWDAPAEMEANTPCPGCAAPTARPDIVWFGEMPYAMDDAWEAIETCDLFVAIGTSGQVYPAAAFAQTAGRAGARTLELNLEPSDNARDFDKARYGKATEIVPEWVRSLLG